MQMFDPSAEAIKSIGKLHDLCLTGEVWPTLLQFYESIYCKRRFSKLCVTLTAPLCSIYTVFSLKFVTLHAHKLTIVRN